MERNNPNRAKLVTQREIFGLIVQMLEDVKSLGYKKIFVRKHNKKNEFIRYNARFVP